MVRLLGFLCCLVIIDGPSILRAQPLEVDHTFVFVSRGAPEARTLRDAGFVVMSDTAHHTGQGTASIFVMFRNVYLELIWVEEPSDFEKAGLGMAERRAAHSGSPFGVGLRRATAEATIPFPTEPYSAEWMAGSEPIRMAAWSGSVAEPLIFVVPEAMQWNKVLAQAPQLESFTQHRAAMHDLTSVRIVGPGLPVESAAVAALKELEVVEFEGGQAHVLHLTFNDGARGETLDLRPALPVVFHY